MAQSLDPKLVGSLLGLAVHDLRNPLSALQSNLGFLRSQADTSPEIHEALEDVGISCEALSRIIDNVELLAATLRTERLAGVASFSVTELVKDAMARVQAAAQSYGVSVEFKPAHGGDFRVTAPREMLAVALSNLLRNAIQHGPEGRTIDVTLSRDEGWATLRIEDEGVQLDKALWKKVFSAAGQVASKTLPANRYSRGFGLFAAALAAQAAGAQVAAVAPSGRHKNAFELRFAIDMTGVK